jgi:hypothetical protein
MPKNSGRKFGARAAGRTNVRTQNRHLHSNASRSGVRLTGLRTQTDAKYRVFLCHSLKVIKGESREGEVGAEMCRNLRPHRPQRAGARSAVCL